MTNEEFEALKKQLLPQVADGQIRPEENIATNLEYATNFPQLIENDPVDAAIFNLMLIRLLSNDSWLKNDINSVREYAQNVQQYATDYAGVNVLKRNKKYEIGDIAYSTNLPTWARLECVVEGITANSEPAWGTTAGALVVDGAVTWIIDDIRDSTNVGQIVGDIYVRSGYTKANGATVNRADYPRLLKLATDNNLFYNDGTRVFTGTTTSNSTSISGISALDIAKLRVGFTITGTGITTGTTITAISSTTITISLVATVSGTATISYGNATNFPRLFGGGDGSITFVVPDMRGVTRRFLDDGKGYDTNRLLGTYQADELKSHQHTIYINRCENNSRGDYGRVPPAAGYDNYNQPFTSTATGGTETRIKNIAEYALIKY